MDNEYDTWHDSPHQDVPCVQCHIGPELKDKLQHKVTALNQVVLHVTNRVPDQIRMKEPLPDSICKGCHEEKPDGQEIKYEIVGERKHKEEGRPEQRTLPAHKLHAQKEKVLCVECHNNLTHGKLALRFTDPEATLQAKKAKELVDAKPPDPKHEYYRPYMEICQECHLKQSVALLCKGCHTEPLVTSEHKQPNFDKSPHGAATYRDPNQCALCHVKRECEECHRGRE